MSRGTFVLAAVAILATLPASAAADSPQGTANGISYVLDQTAIGAGQPAAVNAACQPGTRLIGSATNTNTNGSAGILSSLRPEDSDDENSRSDDAVSAFAHNPTGIGANMVVFALCSPGKVSYPSRTTTLPVGDTGTRKVPCPDGTKVLSGGFFLDGLNSDVHLNAARPFDDGDDNARPEDGWKVRVTNLAGNDKLYQAWAFCRAGVKPVYLKLADTVSAGSADFTSLACPDQTRSVAGIGADVRGNPDGRRISGLEPADDTSQGEPDPVPDDRGFVEVDNPTASPADYTLHLICAAL